jgi:hypothetical protein
MEAEPRVVRGQGSGLGGIECPHRERVVGLIAWGDHQVRVAVVTQVWGEAQVERRVVPHHLHTQRRARQRVRRRRAHRMAFAQRGERRVLPVEFTETRVCGGGRVRWGVGLVRLVSVGRRGVRWRGAPVACQDEEDHVTSTLQLTRVGLLATTGSHQPSGFGGGGAVGGRGAASTEGANRSKERSTAAANLRARRRRGAEPARVDRPTGPKTLPCPQDGGPRGRKAAA